MKKPTLQQCYSEHTLILTEGAVGQRIEREFHIKPDEDIFYAGLIYNERSRNALSTIYRQYLQIAQDFNLPILLMTNTRRANIERVKRSKFRDMNIMADYASFLFELSQKYRCEAYVGGMMGCRGDAYSGGEGLTTEDALAFHAWQADAFRQTKPDFLYAAIMPCLPEAIGMAKSMEPLGLPYIVSLMIRRNGRLPDGNTIHDAIAAIDGAAERKPLCYMTNCVHPAILLEALDQPHNKTELVRERFQGIQANAACMEPDRLDGSRELRSSAPDELADHFITLLQAHPLKILGGCCGTDDSHIREMAVRLSR